MSPELPGQAGARGVPAGADPGGTRGGVPVSEREDGGMWPRTNRLLPWLVAAFLAMVWLVPFDSIIAPFSLGVDSKLDRVMLVIVAGVWLLIAAGGGRYGPRFRRSPLNFALLLFIVAALASIATRLTVLTNLDELSPSIKQVALLLSYVTFFYFVVTVIRPEEVRNLLKFMVILACLTAIGTVWEYRTGTNLFYNWAHSLFKGFTVLQPASTAGSADVRQVVEGPTQTPLADAAILSIALPFAFIFMFHAKERRTKILWYLATGIILAGTVATLRKTAILIPLGALFTICVYLPKKRLLRYTPAFLLLVVAIKIAAPHAISQIKYQFENFNGNSTTHRTSEYPAVTADILAHPLLGRGYGSYDPQVYMILDDQYLGTLVETGFLGFAAYLFVLLTGAAVARKAIRSGDPERAPPAIALMGAVVGFAVASATFDVLAFAQAPYLLLFVLALAVISAEQPAARSNAVPTRAPRNPRFDEVAVPA